MITCGESSHLPREERGRTNAGSYKVFRGHQHDCTCQEGWGERHLAGLERTLIQSAHLEIHQNPKYKCRCEIIPQISLQAGQEGGKPGSLHCWFLRPPWASIAGISSDTCWKSLLVSPDPQGTTWTWETTNQLLSEGVSFMHRVVQGLKLWDQGCGRQNKPLDSGAHSQGVKPFFVTSLVFQLSGHHQSFPLLELY